MDFVLEIFGSKRLGAKILFIGLVNVLIGLWIAFAISYFDISRRLNVIEFGHQIFCNPRCVEQCNYPEIPKHPTYHKSLPPIHKPEGHEYRHELEVIDRAIMKLDKIETEIDEIKRLAEQHDYLDRSGRTDYALETAGARVLSIGGTKLITVPKWVSFFGLNQISNYFSNGPNRAIQPSIQPGECFGFSGTGEINIKLIKSVFIEAVSIEHILPQMSPNGNISSAPSNFSVYGIENENAYTDTGPIAAIHLGDFRYEIARQKPLQLFELSRNATQKSLPIVRFVFTSNHGDPNCTCVYRIRVHGSLTKPY